MLHADITANFHGSFRQWKSGSGRVLCCRSVCAVLSDELPGDAHAALETSPAAALLAGPEGIRLTALLERWGLHRSAHVRALCLSPHTSSMAPHALGANHRPESVSPLQ